MGDNGDNRDLESSEIDFTDPDLRFGGESGTILSHRQIGYGAWREGRDTVRTDDGYVIEGELFTPVSFVESEAGSEVEHG